LARLEPFFSSPPRAFARVFRAFPIAFAMYAAEEPSLWALLYPVAWVSDGDDAEWFGMELPRRVRATGFHVVGANWSTDEPQPWHGAGFSSVISADGTLLAQARTRTGAEIVVADLAPGR